MVDGNKLSIFTILIIGIRKVLMSIIDFFRGGRIKLLKKEIKEKEKLCELQATLNSLYAEELVLDSADQNLKNEKKIEKIIPNSIKYLESQ